MPAPTTGRSLAQIRFAREQRRSASRAERILWAALRSANLGVRFRRQHPCEQFVLDFYCPTAELAIEVDGPLHDQQAGYDRWRDGQLARQGIQVLRFPTEAIEYDVVLVVDEIGRVLRERQEGLKA